MTTPRPIDDAAELPSELPVSVLMERRPGVTRWAAFVWQAVGVVVGDGPALGRPDTVVDRDGYRQLRYGGLKVRFHADEAADYYHNLTAPAPGCYVVAAIERVDGEDVPRPVRVTLNFDEANAYGDGDWAVYHVPLGADLYPWVERFVVTHYEPEPKKKRKLKSAREQRGQGESE